MKKVRPPFVPHLVRRCLPALGWLLAAVLSAGQAAALESLDEEGMSAVSGAGIALPFENIRVQMAPTSFLELTGVSFVNCTSPGVPAGCVETSFKRGDLRYYGLTMSQGAIYSNTSNNKMVYNLSNANTMNWDRSACSGGFNGMGCPTSQYGINAYSTADNPFVLRAFDYTKMGYAGSNSTRTVLEFIGPSNMDPFRWAFWGEVEAGRTVAANGAITGSAGLLKSQTMILGKAAARIKPPSLYGYDDTGANANPYAGPILRIFQDERSESFGMNYVSRLSGDFRFSVNQADNAHDGRGDVPTFTPEEGLYFNDVNAYMPLGQLNYQSLVFNRSGTGGNFILNMTAIPNTAAVYDVHYSLPTLPTGCGPSDPTCTPANQGYNRSMALAHPNYHTSHGYVEWGTQFPSWANACATALNVGSCSGAQISNVPVNFMGGTGVSTVRFAGSNSLAAGSSTTTYTLAAQPMVAGYDNFGGGHWTDTLCEGAFGADQACNKFMAGTAPAVNFTFTTAWNASSTTGGTTRQAVIDAGGFVFVSRSSSSTWQVPNNQNGTDVNSKLLQVENDKGVKQARSNQTDEYFEWAWVGPGCSCTRYELSVDATPDTAAIQARADAIFANNPNDNGRAMITMSAINLGSSRVEGMQINHMRFTSLGAN